MAVRFIFQLDNILVQLPVNPEEIVIKSSGNNKTEEIIQLGEINLLKDMKLKTLEIQGFLPETPDAPYVLTTGDFKGPQFYIDFFENARKQRKPLELTITDTNIVMSVSIEDLEYGLTAGDPDTQYTLSLKEYRPFTSKVVKIIIPETPTEPVKVAPPIENERLKTGFAIGDTVVANGKYWYTSYGDNPHGTFNNFTGKISHIVANKDRKYRYHITTLNGGYRGWLAEDQITHK